MREPRLTHQRFVGDSGTIRVNEWDQIGGTSVMPDLTLKLAANGFILLIAVTGWGLENRWHDRRTRVRRHWARPDCTHRGRSARGWRSDMAHAQPRRGGTRAQRKDRARRADTGKRAAYETVSHSRRAALSVVAMAVMAIVVATPALGSDSNAAKPSASAVSDVPQELRVGAWNVLKLGHGYRKNWGRVENWRAYVRVRWRFRRFRFGPQSGSHSHVSSSRSSNRTGGSPASGSRTRSCLRPRKAGRSRGKVSEVVFLP